MKKKLLELKGADGDTKAHVQAEDEAEEIVKENESLKESGFIDPWLKRSGSNPSEAKSDDGEVEEDGEKHRRGGIDGREASRERGTTTIQKLQYSTCSC